MTGGYVDQEDLARLMRFPTMATAADVYEHHIGYWFEKGPDMNTRVRDGFERRMKGDPYLAEIADRHLPDWPPNWLT